MNELALREQGLDDVMSLGQVLAKSGFFSDTRDAGQAVVKVLAGRELGFGPIASMTGVYIVKGRVTLSANLMAAAIKRSRRYNYRVREHSDRACRIEFFEGNESVGESGFTIEDAQRAGLMGNQTWKSYPKSMLFARAMSNGVKWFCPDIFGGPVYTPDELGADVDGEGEMIEATARPVIQVVNKATGEILDAPSTNGNGHHAPTEPAERMMSEQQRAKILELAGGDENAVIQAIYHVTSIVGDVAQLDELTHREAADIIKHLQAGSQLQKARAKYELYSQMAAELEVKADAVPNTYDAIVTAGKALVETIKQRVMDLYEQAAEQVANAQTPIDVESIPELPETGAPLGEWHETGKKLVQWLAVPIF